jgi:hypothetical protein
MTGFDYKVFKNYKLATVSEPPFKLFLHILFRITALWEEKYCN